MTLRKLGQAEMVIRMADAMSDVAHSETIWTLVDGVMGRELPRNGSRDFQELGMTSAQMVSLMLAIEAEFDLVIPDHMLIPANFRSINNIEDLLRDLGR
jgi:acyl carrier protein